MVPDAPYEHVHYIPKYTDMQMYDINKHYQWHLSNIILTDGLFRCVMYIFEGTVPTKL